MADAIFRIALLLLLLAWFGRIVYVLAAACFDAWKAGRLRVIGDRLRGSVRVVSSSVRPIEFWLMMAFYHVMLVVFAAVCSLCIYGICRIVISHQPHGH